MDYATYKAKRADGYTTPGSLLRVKLHAAQYGTATVYPWRDGDGYSDIAHVADIERDGFAIHIVVESDHDCDWSTDEGKFVSRRDDHDTYPTASCRSARQRTRNAYEERNVYNYYRPAETAASVAAYYTKNGYSRGVAWEKAMEQMRSVVDYATGDTLYAVQMTVTASRAGVALGSASVGGVTFSYDTPTTDVYGYLNETADDLVTEALHEAQGRLAELVASAS